jgi:hypothetical protein
MIQRITPRIGKYDFSDSDLVRAKMLSQESIAYLEHQATDLVAELVNITFSSDPVIQHEQIFQYIATQSRYRFLMETLAEVQETYEHLAAADGAPAIASNPPTTF